MASTIITCSLRPEEKEFLDLYKLSPTQLLKEKIWEMKGMMRRLAQSRIEELKKIIAQQSMEIARMEQALNAKENGIIQEEATPNNE